MHKVGQRQAEDRLMMLNIIGAPYMKEPEFEKFVAKLREPLEDPDDANEFDAEGLAALRKKLTGR